MTEIVLSVVPLSFVWQTDDPFLFCVHHRDDYPAGDGALGPRASLEGRRIGQDFGGRDGWNMYHGQVVPGFPQHPHRGFETVTLVRRGFVDHADSLGATGRFGGGDAQWMTAGKGVVHSEMFPLVHPDADNPLELFQIWLNLPSSDKLVDPHYTMFWAEDVPRVTSKDEGGRRTEVTVVAGSLGDAVPPPPPPKSWASRARSDVAIWTIRMAPNAAWTAPPASAGTRRTLYFFEGEGLSVAGRSIPPRSGVSVLAEAPLALQAGPTGAELLLLQGRPIGEPVAHHGPFVMNTRDELRQAFDEYHRTRFGGWPWDRDDPVHAPTDGRFARHADGRVERTG